MALFRKAATAALACALLLALPASPAFAHDTLKRSSPAKNAEVSSVEEIELEYSASVKFPFVVLHDATGEEVALGEPRLDGPLVSAEVPEPLTPGSYVIAWRVVSSDGHPIEGEIPFSVKGSSSASASPAGPAAATPPGAAPGTGAAQPSAAAPEQAAGPAVEPAAGRSAEPAGVPGWIWGGLAVLVVLGAFVLFRSSRRRPDREEVNAD
ncbi:copper resistance CopC family protein [Nonomuraea rubra]|uniref:Methionine-rich copper-binding protein CopC n=1 Tax=Nonomuraea rubra TaxID=46180 RepID=A0A7X0NYV0_9ACTN|nr:copper resistance protein CopC [Nonomuraea rubra]MBB6552147.1 methionine-rich copper-binding protein CopC [Nonomuraea rubra]